MRPLHVVILAGGSGTRFWPASRARRPKQVLPLLGGSSLLRATYERVGGLTPGERVWVATNASQAEGVRAELPDLADGRLIVEPEGRDTAPGIALAAACVEASEPRAIIAFLPADHVVSPAARLRELIAEAAELAADDETIVTFGVRPTRPATGYGYLEVGGAVAAGAAARRVARFHEKPDLATASAYVGSGRHWWNSGMFVCSYRALHAAMVATAPELAKRTDAMLSALRTGDRRAAEVEFLAAPRQSIDFAVMERAPAVAAIEADLTWSDLGSFAALGDVAGRDEHDNTVATHAGASVVLKDCASTTVYAEGDRTVAALGVEGLLIAAVGDAVLVVPRDRAEDVKALIETVRDRGLEERL